MKMFKGRESAGMGMVEVLMAVAMAGGLSLTVAKLMENASQDTKQFEAKTENINLKGVVQNNLSNSQACINTFGPLITQANMTTLSASASNSVTVPSIKDKANSIKYSTASTNIDPLKITSINLTNYNSGAGTAELVIQSTFKKSTNNTVSVKPMKIPITFNIQNPTSASPTLLGCSTSAIGGEWMLGGNAGTVDGQDYIGTSDAQPLNFRVNNIPSGRLASSGSTLFGYQAGAYASTGALNTGFGSNVLRSTTGSANASFGYDALRSLTTGSSNTVVGYQAGMGLTTGSNNIFIGRSAGSAFTTESNKLVIEGNSSSTTPLIQGDFSAGTVGIDLPAGATAASKLTVGNIGTEYGNSMITGSFYRDVSGSGHALMGKINPDSSNQFQIGVSGYCTTTGTSVSSYCHGVYGVGYYGSPGGGGRSYGTKGIAGNGTSGWNYGIYGLIQGSNNGTAVFGTTTGDVDLTTLYDPQSKYAGVFSGPVHVTGKARVEGTLAVGPTNTVSGTGAVAFGANHNINSGAGLAAGTTNTVSGWMGMAFGQNNTITGDASYAMGWNQTVSADRSYSFGSANSVTADYAIAMGTNATAAHSGSMVLGSYGNAVASTTNNQMMARFPGGYVFYSAASGTIGVQLAANASSWSVASDRNIKWDIKEIDLEEHLRKVAKLPISKWKYKGQDIPHMGPMAQDFYYIFRLGDGDDKVITTQDMDGVTIAAVKGLEARTRKLAQENEALKKDNQDLKKRLERLEALILNK